LKLSSAEIRARRAELQALTRAYRREERAMSYRDLCARQSPPWASISCGAAGIAAALVAQRRCPAGDLARANAWLAAARRGARRTEAFRFEGHAADLAADSLSNGPDGVELLSLLVAHARGEDERSARLVDRFLARCRRRRGGPTEFLFGSAGYLTALVVLHRALRDPRVLVVADELARDLLDRAGGRQGWARAKDLAFAHGRAGTFHALLGWSREADRLLPPSFFDDLERLAEDVDKRSTLAAGAVSNAPKGMMERSWCNGAAGLTLLWARAYEHTPSRLYLDLARRAARSLTTHTAGVAGDLCCGLGGRAYALLAMHRIEPGRDFYERALEMGSRALSAMLEGAGEWPNGLYKGFPGLVCLGADLSCTTPNRVGFPLVEGYRWRPVTRLRVDRPA
jgi:serine/threonine-protein kinase